MFLGHTKALVKRANILPTFCHLVGNDMLFLVECQDNVACNDWKKKQTNKQTDNQASKQTKKQTNKETNKQTSEIPYLPTLFPGEKSMTSQHLLEKVLWLLALGNI